ncbi:hypothetical protein NEMBOFW57_006664 [Staphylotrichum longicolle]|uniref:Heterokaryon incompatibility domain-containing protein n=1 Tax=Staphylotrichum longicolle TaxID=669026 RepID=A0AAD4ETB0_9PEZI|nr:hypothetical protein NEMBOFW57_006664 [Staphylotrichum longicolle]
MSASQSDREIMSANQSRQRAADPGPNPVSSTTPKIDNTLPYRGEELARNSLRLLQIEPAEDHNAPLVCTLSMVTFGSTPRFEALSYTWGPEELADIITLNGVPFQVRKNLRNALRFLRRQVAQAKANPLFWIDAICINQLDVGERNRQLPLMKEIYFRADTVVVWLGSRYEKFQAEMVGTVKPEKGETQEEDSPHGNSVQLEMVRCLQADEYWGRLWILQEIGRATRLRVCFGNQSSTWENFMLLIAMHHGDGNTGPLRLDRLLRKEKYNDSHTLKRLLEEHREAKCLLPIDKVYGLVGLATDAAGFPMDYNKSLYDVWKDTMVFMNAQNLFKEDSQIVLVGALVKSLLMENHSDPWSQIWKQHKDEVDSTQLINDRKSSLVFCLKAFPLGCIVSVGPLASDVVSSPEDTAKWPIAIQNLFPGNELGGAHWEYDKLLGTLLESDDSKIETMCFNRPSNVVWEQQKSYTGTARDYIEKVENNTPVRLRSLDTPQQTTERSAPVQPRLYLARNWHTGFTRHKMGVATGLVQLRDLVCWVRSSRRALLVRVVESDNWRSTLRVFGTALATDDMSGPTPDEREFAERWESLDNERQMEIQVDAGTIFMLLE